MVLNVYIAKRLNQPLSQVNVVLSLLLCIPLGVGYRTVFSPRHVSPAVRQCVGLVWGLALGWFNLGSDLIILIGVCALCYILTWKSKSTEVHKVVFFVALFILSGCQIYRMVHHYGDNIFDYTGRLMLIFQKLTYVACSLHDGCGRDENELTENQRKQKISSMPTVLEYFAYMFHYSTLLVGPTCTLIQYRDFITGQDIKQYTKDHHQEPSPFKAGALRFVVALSYLIGFVILSRLLPFWQTIDPEFINSSSLTWRIFRAWFSLSILRLKYYFAFASGEASVIISGLGFNGYDSHGDPRWDGIIAVYPHKIEFALSLRDLTENWNIFTAKWLRSVVHDRVPRYKVPLTFATSMIWHGFYPGYFVVCVFVYFYFITCKAVRRQFYHVYDNLSFPAYAVLRSLHIITSCLMTTYFCGIFVFLRFDYCIIFLRSLYFYGHICCTIILLLIGMRRIYVSTAVQKDRLDQNVNELSSGVSDAKMNGILSNTKPKLNKDKAQ